MAVHAAARIAIATRTRWTTSSHQQW